MQLETIRVNVLGMLNLADICFEKKIHLTTYATGCIFHYDKDFPEGSGKGFKEADKPNFTGSYYSYTKASLFILRTNCNGCKSPALSLSHHASRQHGLPEGTPASTEALAVYAIH